MALSLGCHEVPAAMALFSRLHPLKREPMGSCLGAAGAAKMDRATRSETRGRCYSYDTLIDRLAQGFQGVAAARRPFSQDEHAAVRQRHLPGHRLLPAADQADVGDGVMGGRDTDGS
jgi:hypothetical protein